MGDNDFHRTMDNTFVQPPAFPPQPMTFNQPPHSLGRSAFLPHAQPPLLPHMPQHGPTPHMTQHGPTPHVPQHGPSLMPQHGPSHMPQHGPSHMPQHGPSHMPLHVPTPYLRHQPPTRHDDVQSHYNYNYPNLHQNQYPNPDLSLRPPTIPNINTPPSQLHNNRAETANPMETTQQRNNYHQVQTNASSIPCNSSANYSGVPIKHPLFSHARNDSHNPMSGCYNKPPPVHTSDAFGDINPHNQVNSIQGQPCNRQFLNNQQNQKVINYQSVKLDGHATFSLNLPPRHNSLPHHPPHAFSNKDHCTPTGDPLNTGCSSMPAHPLHPDVICFKKDQDWVDKWMQQKLDDKYSQGDTLKIKNGKFHQEDNQQIDCGHHSNLKLQDVHMLIAHYKLLLAQHQQCLPSKVDSITNIKIQLEAISSQLLDKSYQENVKQLVQARRKKRERKRKRKSIRRDEWLRKSDEIDMKRKHINEENKQTQRRAALRQESDAVLREVRCRTTDTVAHQLLLGSLRDLRQHRLNKGEGQGYVTTDRHDDHFNKVLDGLEEMLQNQLADYGLEEQTLQQKLDHHNTAKHLKPAPEAVSPGEAKAVLFGTTEPLDRALYASYTAADDSMEMLFSRRRAWDQHLTPTGGTGVPVCWVIPPEISRSRWKHLLPS